MSCVEQVLSFACAESAMVGILSLPKYDARRGVLIVVGGPQYRAGSHRQFTLLARDLADSGLAAMRFDYRGMGDSDGQVRSFDEVDDDLRAAIDAFFVAVPTLESVVLWGLCDGACAALFYAPSDVRVSGLVLLNPWVHTEAGAARTRLKHYYVSRLMQKEFWQKLLRGRFDGVAAARSLIQTLQTIFEGKAASQAVDTATCATEKATLPERMRQGFRDFGGKVLIVIAGHDLTAKQFCEVVAGTREWRALMRLPRVTRYDLPGADHTFSRRVWRDQVAVWTVKWVASW